MYALTRWEVLFFLREKISKIAINNHTTMCKYNVGREKRQKLVKKKLEKLVAWKRFF